MSRAMGSHHSAAPLSVNWFTPPAIVEALGGWESFDLDPATASDAPFPTALQRYTRADNGLLRPWFGRVWLNPPYTNADLHAFMGRLADHGRGTALIFARTETQAFFETVWQRASGLLFLEGRLHFHRPDGTRAAQNAGAPSVLCAYGVDDTDILAAAKLGGQFVPLRLPRSVVIAGLEPTWRKVVDDWVRQQRGPVKLDELYRALAEHPKTQGRANWKAKVRQTLQRSGYTRVERGQWAA